MDKTTAATSPRRGMLLAECLVLFGAVPVAIAVLLPPRMMFGALFAFTSLGLVLLHRTPGFSWRHLRVGRVDLMQVGLFFLATLGLSWAVMEWVFPGRAFALARHSPGLLLLIVLLYPLLSALPQELIFRALWFRRYRAVLPDGRAGIVLNAAVFSLAHLMYWSWIVAAMTFAGGLVFATAYKRSQGFVMALTLHAAAGNAVFLGGLGVLFYSGNVVRPF